MTDEPKPIMNAVTAPNASPSSEDRIKALEAKIHALETEKRADRLHTHLPKANTDGKSMEFLDGAVWGVEEYKKTHATSPVVPKTNSAVAEITPKTAPLKGVLEAPCKPVDEDEDGPSEGSDI